MLCERNWFIGSFSDCHKLNGKCETGDLVLTWFWKMPGSIGGCKGRMQMCLSRDTCCFLGSRRGSGTSGWKWKIRQRLFERPSCFSSSLEARWGNPQHSKWQQSPAFGQLNPILRVQALRSWYPLMRKLKTIVYLYLPAQFHLLNMLSTNLWKFVRNLNLHLLSQREAYFHIFVSVFLPFKQATCKVLCCYFDCLFIFRGVFAHIARGSDRWVTLTLVTLI